MVSAACPGGKGTMIRTGRSGQAACARSTEGAARIAARAAGAPRRDVRNVMVLVLSLCFCPRIGPRPHGRQSSRRKRDGEKQHGTGGGAARRRNRRGGHRGGARGAGAAQEAAR